MDDKGATYTWDSNLGSSWANLADAMDVAFQVYGDRALEALAPQEGEAVLDVGCGCGATTLALGSRVGASGRALGVDIAPAMLETARQRAAAAGATNVQFEVGDAGVAALGGPYDGVFSRFGVMFFDDPIGAFAHIRSEMRSGGRLAFVCWQARDENVWMTVPYAAVLPHIPVTQPSGPGQPGGVMFADPAFANEVLANAGFTEFDAQPFVADPPLPGGTEPAAVADALLSLIPHLAAGARNASASDRARAVDAICEAIEPYRTNDGYRLRGATWIVTARA